MLFTLAKKLTELAQNDPANDDVDAEVALLE